MTTLTVAFCVGLAQIQLAEAKAKEDAAQAQPEEPSKDVGAGAPPPLPFDASTPGDPPWPVRLVLDVTGVLYTRMMHGSRPSGRQDPYHRPADR